MKLVTEFRDPKVTLTQTCDHKDIKAYLDELAQNTLGTPEESKEVRNNKNTLYSWLWLAAPMWERAPFSMLYFLGGRKPRNRAKLRPRNGCRASLP